MLIHFAKFLEFPAGMPDAQDARDARDAWTFPSGQWLGPMADKFEQI